MTAAELIAALRVVPPETRVMVQGYEGGLDDPAIGNITTVDLNVHDSGVYGPHALPGEGWEEPRGTCTAIILSRRGR